MSARLMIWGLYAVLCHAAFILLYSRACSDGVLEYIQTGKLLLMLEHTVMSLTAVFVGGFLADLVKRKQKK